MKKLISAVKIKQAHKDGKKELFAPIEESIVTPEARSLAKKLGINIIETASPDKAQSGSARRTVDEDIVKSIVEKVAAQLPPEKRDSDLIKKTVLQVLEQYRK